MNPFQIIFGKNLRKCLLDKLLIFYLGNLYIQIIYRIKLKWIALFGVLFLYRFFLKHRLKHPRTNHHQQTPNRVQPQKLQFYNFFHIQKIKQNNNGFHDQNTPHRGFAANSRKKESNGKNTQNYAVKQGSNNIHGLNQVFKQTCIHRKKDSDHAPHQRE